MRGARSIVVTDAQRRTLEKWARGRSTPVRQMQRAQIVLRAARGISNKDIAADLGTDRQTVGRWRLKCPRGRRRLR